MQRASFAAMGVLGGFASMPLFFNEPLSLVGLVTLYSTGAIAAKIVLRWRFSKARPLTWNRQQPHTVVRTMTVLPSGLGSRPCVIT